MTQRRALTIQCPIIFNILVEVDAVESTIASWINVCAWESGNKLHKLDMRFLSDVVDCGEEGLGEIAF